MVLPETTSAFSASVEVTPLDAHSHVCEPPTYGCWGRRQQLGRSQPVKLPPATPDPRTGDLSTARREMSPAVQDPQPPPATPARPSPASTDPACSAAAPGQPGLPALCDICTGMEDIPEPHHQCCRQQLMITNTPLQKLQRHPAPLNPPLRLLGLTRRPVFPSAHVSCRLAQRKKHELTNTLTGSATSPTGPTSCASASAPSAPASHPTDPGAGGSTSQRSC